MKKKSNTPRRKRMKKEGRLQCAKDWIKEYDGKNIVKGYAKWFGIAKLDAVNELKTLGIHIDEEYIEKLKIDLVNTIKQNKIKREKRTLFKRNQKEELEFSNYYQNDYYNLDSFKYDNFELERKDCAVFDKCEDCDLPF
jgi:hypothetical protein